jgi:hypothetical protein
MCYTLYVSKQALTTEEKAGIDLLLGTKMVLEI